MHGMRPRGLALTGFKGSGTPDVGPWEESSWGPSSTAEREGRRQAAESHRDSCSCLVFSTAQVCSTGRPQLAQGQMVPDHKQR